MNETSKQEEEVKKIIKDPEKTNDVCIIVDTNVFIWALSKIRDIVNLKTSGRYKNVHINCSSKNSIGCFFILNFRVI